MVLLSSATGRPFSPDSGVLKRARKTYFRVPVHDKPDPGLPTPKAMEKVGLPELHRSGVRGGP